jgi:hypothetical protein
VLAELFDLSLHSGNTEEKIVECQPPGQRPYKNTASIYSRVRPHYRNPITFPRMLIYCDHGPPGLQTPRFCCPSCKSFNIGLRNNVSMLRSFSSDTSDNSSPARRANARICAGRERFFQYAGVSARVGSGRTGRMRDIHFQACAPHPSPVRAPLRSPSDFMWRWLLSEPQSP